jgi:hypothetical protein
MLTKKRFLLLIVIILLVFFISGCKEEISIVNLVFQEISLQNDLPSCGEEMEFFSVNPLNNSEITGIIPLGSVSPPAHVYPVDHMYISVKRNLINEEPIETNIVSPGNAWITEIRGTIYEQNYIPDFSVYISTCEEVKVYFYHLTFISDKLLEEYNKVKGYCRTETHGGITGTTCEKRMFVEISAGELIGSSGGNRPSFDIGAIDMRREPVQYANSKHWKGYNSFVYGSCPFNYFTEEARLELESKIGSVDGEEFTPSSMNPICGYLSKDISGTAQGIWFVKGNKKTSPEDPNLALVPYHFNESIGVFSVGTSLPGITPERYYSNYREGLINTNFKDVKPGTIHCYEMKDRYTNEDLVIILKLVDKESLLIEKLDLNRCNDGSWGFSEPVEFVR